MNLKNVRLIFCLPGNNFSNKFLTSWTETLSWCYDNGIKFAVSCRQSCNIYYVRNMCLGGDVTRGEDQKPFDGKVPYTHILWIDSDIVWKPQQIESLLKRDKDVIAGLYKMEDNKHYACVEAWNEDFFKQNGFFKFIDDTDLKEKKLPFRVSYVGMGFMLVKNGIIEKMKYPWFKAIDKKIDNMVDFTMEDVSFCLRLASEVNTKVFVDPEVIVGHEKKFVI